jgi:CheY-like chemotaxis protein
MLLHICMTACDPGTKHLHILVVDDEAASRSALGTVLKLAGHEAHFAADGDEALEMFDHSGIPVDLVITDHMMVRLSGVEFVRRLRERGFHGEIFVLTAYAGTLHEEEYRRLEVAGIMEKPFDIAELRRWITCIHGCRETLPNGEKAPGRLRQIDFCWVRHGWN